MPGQQTWNSSPQSPPPGKSTHWQPVAWVSFLGETDDPTVSREMATFRKPPDAQGKAWRNELAFVAGNTCVKSNNCKRKGLNLHLNWNVKCCAMHETNAYAPIAILAKRSFHVS